MNRMKQQKPLHQALLILICGLLCGCSSSPKIAFDPDKAHHGDGEFISERKASMISHFFMRLREDGPPPRDPQEVASIVGNADLELIGSYAAQPRVTWVGHATSLVQYRGVNYLTDPHLTQRPFTYDFLVEPRYTQPALSFEQMPPIDFVVISHNHFDSLDRDTVAMFGDSVLWYVPLGLKNWFQKRGISADRVVELDWWQSHHFNDRVEVTMTPAQHWSRRTLSDTNKTLWGGWVVEIDDFRSYFVGDTGYNDTYFKEIGSRLGPFRLAMIPIGAYAPRYFMGVHHVDPAQAIDIHLEVRAQQSLPIHWGTFELTIEPMLEPAQLLTSEMTRRGLPLEQFRPVKIGDTLVLD
jgi:N-acyl-phosphatidylethanolamine-hydrolysing phospholipase D